MRPRLLTSAVGVLVLAVLSLSLLLSLSLSLTVAPAWAAAPDVIQADARQTRHTDPRTDAAPIDASRDDEATSAAASDTASEMVSETAPIDYAAARATLREVLARREFQRRDTSKWSDQLSRWVDEWVTYLLDRFVGRQATARGLARVLAWLVALGALAALATWLFRARLPAGASGPLALAIAPRLSSREWAARARAALRQGDAREAVRCAYHAALFRLEEQGVWRVDESRTPREYVWLLPAEDERRAALADLTREFEQVWYAARPSDGGGVLERLEVLGCSAPSERAI